VRKAHRVLPVRKAFKARLEPKDLKASKARKA